jgi:branched-chain amino acid transport system substrate-binding protein
VREAGSLDQAVVIKALDHARIAQGPGGPAEMVPGQHHARMNMYIGQASAGKFRIVKNLAYSIRKKRTFQIIVSTGNRLATD